MEVCIKDVLLCIWKMGGCIKGAYMHVKHVHVGMYHYNQGCACMLLEHEGMYQGCFYACET